MSTIWLMASEPIRYVSLRIEPELYDRIHAAAKADRRSLNTYLTILIERALDEAEAEGGEPGPGPRGRSKR